MLLDGDAPADSFACLALARDGVTLATFRGTAEGVILRELRGEHGFGYDPMFFFPAIGKTFAELSAEEKSHYSHRGAAFRNFLELGRMTDSHRGGRFTNSSALLYDLCRFSETVSKRSRGLLQIAHTSRLMSEVV